MDLIDQPFPEAERLGVWIVDAEDPHAALDPEPYDIEQRQPQPFAIVALEIERVDVLILLRRVFRGFDRSVGTMAEPGRMLANPGMVGRSLQRRVDRGMPAGVRADCPRTAGSAGAGNQRIVGSFAKARADWVDRRQVEDIE